MPTELTEKIIKLLDTHSALQLAHTSQGYNTLMSKHFRHETGTSLDQFGLAGTPFLQLMKETDMIISGSLPLLLLSKAIWTPNNLDIYVPSKNIKRFSLQLKRQFNFHSYKPLVKTKAMQRVDYEEDLGVDVIEEVFWFSKDDKVCRDRI